MHGRSGCPQIHFEMKVSGNEQIKRFLLVSGAVKEKGGGKQVASKLLIKAYYFNAFMMTSKFPL